MSDRPNDMVSDTVCVNMTEDDHVKCTSGFRGGAPGARPPNGRECMIFFMLITQIFHNFSSLASLANHFKPFFI